MSRIGKKEIPLPKGVEVKKDGNAVTVKGPKGTLSTKLVEGIDVKVENNVVQFTRRDEEKKTRAFHGLMRALVASNVKGVSALPDLMLERIAHFFEHYKDLEKGKWVKVEGWAGVDAARQEILDAAERYKAAK